jgi:biopolymer transport protein ExbD
MADQQRVLDVWLLDMNEVYSAVPFNVVADWLQQGRLLGEDRVRIAGNKKWHDIADVPAFAPYLPRPEPTEAEDQAEALEPVELGLDFQRVHEEEDEDVDMIPLIDISLVLLIFFMMTATVASGALSPIKTPAAQHKLDDLTPGTFWVGIDTKNLAGDFEKDADGRDRPWYSLGIENDVLVPPTTDEQQLLTALGKKLEPAQGDVTLRLRAERSIAYDVVRDATLELQGLETKLNRGREQAKRLKFVFQAEVSEPKQ